jgi:hypothetical protein
MGPVFANTPIETTLPTVVAPALSTIALILLLVSGASKIFDPNPTTGAMRAARLPASISISRGLGVFELVAGILGLVLGGIWLLPAGLLYVGFLAFTVAALQQRLPIQSCGCFGRQDTPPTVLHVGFNALSAGVLAIMVATAQLPVPWSESPINLALYLAFGGIGAYLAYLVLALLPRTLQMTATR